MFLSLKTMNCWVEVLPTLVKGCAINSTWHCEGRVRLFCASMSCYSSDNKSVKPQAQWKQCLNSGTIIYLADEFWSPTYAENQTKTYSQTAYTKGNFWHLCCRLTLTNKWLKQHLCKRSLGKHHIHTTGRKRADVEYKMGDGYLLTWAFLRTNQRLGRSHKTIYRK